MKYVLQLSIILGITFAGECLSALLPLPIHASIYGMLLMFALFATGVLKVAQVEETGLFLIAVMPLFFVPPGVGLLDVWHEMADHFWQIAAVFVFPTVLVFVVTGRTAEFFLKGKG